MEKIDTKSNASDAAPETVLRIVEPSESRQAEPVEGPELVKKVVSLTGLPEDLVGRELNQILENNGCSSESLTLDQLRDALLTYLETLSAEMEAGHPDDLQ